MMKWIEILFGLVLVIAANVGAFFFGWSFKVYLLLMVVAVFIGLVVFKRYMHQRIAEQMLSMTGEERATLMAGLDQDQQVDVANRIKKMEARTSKRTVP